MATSSTTHGTKNTPSRLLVNGALAIADVGVLPGASQLVDGQVKSGVLHVLAAVVAGSVFGPIGWLAVGANSFSRTITGRSLYSNVIEEKRD